MISPTRAARPLVVYGHRRRERSASSSDKSSSVAPGAFHYPADSPYPGTSSKYSRDR